MSATWPVAVALRGIASVVLLVALSASVRALARSLLGVPRDRSPQRAHPSGAPRPGLAVLPAPAPAAASGGAAAERAALEAAAVLAYWWPTPGAEDAKGSEAA